MDATYKVCKQYAVICTREYTQGGANIYYADREELPSMGVGTQIGDFDHLSIGESEGVGHYSKNDVVLVRIY